MTITQEQLDKAVQEAVEKATTGLKAKNDELLAAQKKLKDENKDLKDKTEQTEAEKKAAEEAAALKSGDVEKIKKQLEEKHAKEIAKLNEENTATKSKLDSVLIDGGIADALVKVNVAPQYHDAVKALLKTAHKSALVEQDGKVIAHIDGKPITDFITEWSQGDQGKHYVAAPSNGGGGSKGSGDGSKATVAKKRSEMSPSEKSAYIDEHGQDKYNLIPN